MSAIGAGILGGAVGGGLAVTVLAPLTAANNFLGSYFFGSGMILGERQMYQDDWIKIKKRLDAGESFLVILEEVMKPNTQAVMQMARETVIAVSAEWNKIVLAYLQSIPQSIWDAINKISAGEPTDNPFPLGDGVIGIINGKVQCAAGWHDVNNQCIKNTPKPTPIPADTGVNTQGETQSEAQKRKEEQDAKLQAQIDETVWQKIVGKKTKVQVIATIKAYEALLKQMYASIKRTEDLSTKGALETQIKLYNSLIKAHKLALSWLAKQGTGGARVTP